LPRIITVLAIAAVSIILVTATLLSFFKPGDNTVTSTSEKVTLKVYCAGSLLFPIEKVATAFGKVHSNVDVEVEGHGSIQVIRQVTELGELVDVLMVADYSLIPIMMYNTTMPESSQSFADWNIVFSGNSIVLAYANQSKYADEINQTNWYDILGRPDVSFGFPNPSLDALGYRVPIIIQLAELYYGNDKIFDNLISTNFNPKFTYFKLSANNYIVTIPDVQTPVGKKVYLRASSIQLIPLLESGIIDYCFLYLSNARQQGFKYVELPNEINLGSSAQQDFYEQVRLKFEHQRFASIGLDRNGSTIFYGLTIPKNAPQPQYAAEFVKFILNGEGKNVFDSNWHPIYESSLTDNLQGLPEALRPFVTERSP
jgi:molybdate/tungstate transport system substrate-binding protein